jgi:iron-siderophore transport system permease protein
MSARRVSLRAHGLSVRVDLRVLAVLGLLGALTLVALTLNVGRGEFAIAPPDVLAALVGGGDEATRFVVLDLRLPRALTAILVGMALGISGVIFQDLAHNALVSPDVIGISWGASLGAISVIVFGEATGALTVPLAALGGALAAGVLLYGLAWRGGVHGYRLVLIGIGLTTVFSAGVSYVLTQARFFELQRAYVWLVGSLNDAGWEQVWPLTATLAVLLPLALVLGRQLETLQLGDDIARALGVAVEPARLALIAVAIVLTGVAVAAAGPIAFVAFFAPHIARRLCDTVSPSGVLPAAAATGAFMVLASDLAGRLLFGATQMPVGIITAIIAAPYFLYLLQRANRLGATG